MTVGHPPRDRAARPRVAVCMATCQRESFVGRQLESIRDQTDPPDLLVASDDASTDATREVVRGFARTAAFPVELIEHPEPVGLHRGLGAAVARAIDRADVIVLSDDDDLWMPEKVARIRRAFAEHPGASLWFSDGDLIGPDDEPLGRSLWQMHSLTPEYLDDLRGGGGMDRLLYADTITGPAMAVRTSVAAAALPIPTETHAGAHLFWPDGWIALLARLQGDVIIDPDPLIRYRRHAGQLSDDAQHLRPREREDRHARVHRDHRRVELLVDAVAAHEGAVWVPERRRDLESRSRLLRARSAPAGTAGRRRRVVHELIRGGYSRHSSGARTALFDLLRPSR